MKICSTKTEVLHFSRNPDQCSLHVNGATLKQVEKLSILGLHSRATEGKKSWIAIGKPSAVSLALFCSHETKIVEKGKALNFQNSFCPPSHLRSWILGNDWKIAIASASMRTEVFKKNWRSYTLTLFNEVRCSKIRKSLNIEPLFLLIERHQRLNLELLPPQPSQKSGQWRK